ncbi:MAG TPA: hypothetical protein VK000_01785, partial [Luteimonas sp.]|nr:hypothetical protein [Luteimonas sp.]
MSLQALLAEVHPAWYADRFDPASAGALIERAHTSALGRRLLLRALPPALGDGLFAPRPGEPAYRAMRARWPSPRVAGLVRDLGVLAYAPVIRAEVRREPVRWLRATLGNSYLLALDRSVWDGRIGADTHARLAADWDALLAEPAFLQDPPLLGDMLDRQGHAELLAWATRRNRALADWALLLRAPAPSRPVHLPEKAALVV